MLKKLLCQKWRLIWKYYIILIKDWKHIFYSNLKKLNKINEIQFCFIWRNKKIVNNFLFNLLKKMNEKEYFEENGEFKLTRELIESIPSISTISMSSYALDKEGIFLFFIKRNFFFFWINKFQFLKIPSNTLFLFFKKCKK